MLANRCDVRSGRVGRSLWSSSSWSSLPLRPSPPDPRTARPMLSRRTSRRAPAGPPPDPTFASSPWVYVYHTYLNAPLLVARNRVVRLLAAPSAPPPDVILDGIPAGAFRN